MIGIDFHTVRFGDPHQLWLLTVPAALLALWVWRLLRHRGDVLRIRRRRRLPVRQRLPAFGGLLFWLCLIMAIACTVVALARPSATVSLVRAGGIDLVVLQDGSASMHVTDVAGDRWQRSIRFLRVLGEALRWKNDRVALALFAHIAAPQVRLTSDPNTFFFFLDHLDKESPFRLEDATTWDTNIELGIYWGLRLITKDEELHGRSQSAKVFVVISDGQAWSGQVQKSIAMAQARSIPIFVVGVGTTGGGIIPEAPPQPDQAPALSVQGPLRSSLDRASLAQIATAGSGEYLELDRDSDRDIANRIIQAGRRRAPGIAGTQELYWPCLMAAAAFLALGTLALRERAELWLQMAGAGAAMAVLWLLTR